MHIQRIAAAAALAATALVVSACGTRHVSRDIGPDGQAGTVVFPDPAGIVLRGGTFPDVGHLRSIGPGVTKDQLYHLVGRPHFREGLFGVREWDYLFHFRTPEGIRTCQYKVIFDQAALGQGFHWSPSDCASVLETAAPAPVATPEPAAGGGTRIDLSMDALFAFAGSARSDIRPEGVLQLRQIAARLASLGHPEVRVVGYTDRIGDPEANLALSRRRAETIRALLVEQGVPAERVRAEGRGQAEPVTRGCDEGGSRPALIRCLQPDRRVELRISAAQGAADA